MANEIASLIGGISGEQLLGMGRDEQMLAIDGGSPQIARQVRYYEENWLGGGGRER